MTLSLAPSHRAVLRSALCALFGLSLAACAAGGAPPSAPVPAPSPGADVLQRAEFEGNGRDMYQTIAVLRPAWLNHGLDEAGRMDPTRVVVFVGGEYAGDISMLRTMRSDEVGTVQLQGAEHVRGMAPELRDRTVTAGLYVTRSTGRTGETASRAGVSFHAGAMLSGTPGHHAFDALVDAGYDDEGTGRYADPERGNAVATGQLGAWYAVAGPLRAEAHVQRSLRGELIVHGNGRGMEGHIASTDIDAMLSVPLPLPWISLRASAGPSVRILDANWSGSSNPIEPEPTWENSSSIAYGAAAALTASTPLDPRMSLLLEAKGRFYGSQDVGEYRDRLTDIRMEGNSVGVSLGLGYRL